MWLKPNGVAGIKRIEQANFFWTTFMTPLMCVNNHYDTKIAFALTLYFCGCWPLPLTWPRRPLALALALCMLSSTPSLQHVVCSIVIISGDVQWVSYFGIFYNPHFTITGGLHRFVLLIMKLISHVFFKLAPLPSNRHHRRCGDCLEAMRENYQVCSVQYCVQQLCTVRCTHIWTD